MVTPNFRHEFLPRRELRDVTGPTGRVYVTPEGDFPSVTTVLGRALGTAELDAWRERVGEDEARRVSTKASHRGTAVHAIAERFLMNDPDYMRDAMPLNALTFAPLRTVLARHVGTIWGVELPLWSARLMTAGKTDLLCEWDGAPAIVDFKTSAKSKTEDSSTVRKYLLQTATYAVMASETYGLNIQRLVLLFCPDDAIAAHAIVRSRAEFEHAVETVFDPRNRARIGMVDIPQEVDTVSTSGRIVSDETVHPGQEPQPESRGDEAGG